MIETCIRCWSREKLHVLDVQLPNIFMGVGSVVEVLIISLIGRRLAYTKEAIANFVALITIFRVLSDIPSGVLAECIGVQRLMSWSIIMYILGCALSLSMAPSAYVFVIYSVFCGFSSGVFFLSRHIYVANIVGRKRRGTAMAFLSGLLRMSHVIGPAALAVVATRWPEGRYYFAVPLASAFLALVCIWLNNILERRVANFRSDDEDICNAGEMECLLVKGSNEIYKSIEDPTSSVKDLSPTTLDLKVCEEDHTCERFHISVLWMTIVNQWLTIWRLGLYIILYIALRSNRKLLLTFAAMQLNFEDSEIAYLLTLSFVFDACLFPLGGIIMDHFNRRYALVPVTLTLGLAYALLPLFETRMWLYAMSALFGVGDAMGCGIIMTLIADYAPEKFGGPFYGVMRAIQDMGHVLAALAVSVVTHRAGFVACCYLWGALSVVTALWAVTGIPIQDPEVTPKHTQEPEEEE